ncbi:LOW QUALITY PROTEIN: transport and Golgi organization protein 1 [Ixodes scapularis]|uniref:LOW QUALITY PROTEIN: transport and Golgi organization protein 1 n=1 Tax=Ixodes scapularis TaxID=6945 RepID=UPI001A9F9773|nr:LOW QUALITY PROTEIN: transport and Golgi organization protein 1 [Ixodes scapularis]
MALGRSIRCSVFLVSTLILDNISVAFASPSHKWCVDPDCKSKLGVGLSVQNYTPGDESRIALPTNAEVHVYAELDELWEVEYLAKRGFVPKHVIKIQKQTKYKKDLVKVQVEKVGNVVSSLVESDIYGTTAAADQPVATPLVVPAEKSCLFYRTTMFGEICDDKDATPLSPTTSSLFDSNHGTVSASTTEQPVSTTTSTWQSTSTALPGLAVPPQSSELPMGKVMTPAMGSEQLSNDTQFANFTAGDVSENLVVDSTLNQKTESEQQLQKKSEVKTEPEPQERSQSLDKQANTVQSEPQEQPQLETDPKSQDQTASEEEEVAVEVEDEDGEGTSTKPIPGEPREDDEDVETDDAEDSAEGEGLKASSSGVEDTGKGNNVSSLALGDVESDLTIAPNNQLRAGASDLPQEAALLAPEDQTTESLGAPVQSISRTVSVASASFESLALDSTTPKASVADVTLPEKEAQEPLDDLAVSSSTAVLSTAHSTPLHSSDESPPESSVTSSSRSELMKDTSLGLTELFGSPSFISQGGTLREISQRDTPVPEVTESTQAAIQESTLHSDALGETQSPSASSASSSTGTWGQSTKVLNASLESAAAVDEVQLQSSVTVGTEGANQEAVSAVLGKSSNIPPSGLKGPISEGDAGLVSSVTESVVPSAVDKVTTQSSLSGAAMSTPSSVNEAHTMTPQKRVLLQEPGSQPAAMPPLNLGSSSPGLTQTTGRVPSTESLEKQASLSNKEEQTASVTLPSTTIGSIFAEVPTPEPSAPDLSALGSSAPGSSASGSSASGSSAAESSAPELSAVDSSALDLPAPGSTATESSVPEAAALKASAPETSAPGALRDASSAEKVPVESQEDQKPALDLYWAMAREYVFWMLALIPEPLQAAVEGLLPTSSSQPGSLTLILLCGLLGFSVLTLYMHACYVHRRKESSLTGKISSLEQRLFTLVTEKQVLTEQLEQARSQAETARSELQERERRVKTLQEEGEELESCQRERDKVVRELRATLSERTEQLEATQKLLAEKECLITELEVDAEWQASLEEKLREATEERLAWEERAEEARASEKQLETRLAEATLTGDHLWKELDAVKQREQSLSADLEAITQDAAKIAQQVSDKEAELQALLRTVEQIRILQHHWESQDDKTQVEERLKELMDLAQVRQDREQARELQQDLEARLEAQKRHLDAKEAELTYLRAELVESVRARDEAQQESREAVTKLEVLSSYFKERELKLQREIGVQEVQRQQKEADVGSATQRLAMLEQQNASYRSQLASLKQEMEVSERNYKNQLTEQEKRAHENWLAARAAERKLEDANRETANLRQRLTLLEREQMMNSFGPPPPPPGDIEHVHGDTMPEGLTQPPLPHGLLPPPPPLGRLGGPPLPPPPLHPMMGPPMFPPFPPPPPELLKRLRPSPGSFREDSPSPRSRDSRGSPPPLPHFLDPRGGPPFLPRPVRSHQASSTGSGDGRPHRSSPHSSGADSRRNGTGGNSSTAV